MTYSLGAKSRNNLIGVIPSLVRVVEHAIALTKQDFTVQEGLRSIETQKLYVARGVSWTLASKHLKQADGFGHAVDLVPWINGQPRWEWPLIYPIAAAMRDAAIAEGVSLRWGGTWSLLNDINPGAAEMERAVQRYVKSRLAMGKKASIDGPHYEVVP